MIGNEKEERRYGRFGTIIENKENCIKTVFTNGCNSAQCKHKRGHGPDGLYCKIHDPERVIAKNAEMKAKWEAELVAKRKERERTSACLAACEGVEDPQPGELARLRKQLGLA